MKKIITLAAALLIALPASIAQERFSSSTDIFEPAFRTLKVGRTDNFMSAPILRLGTEDRIYISFDELGDEHSDLCYSLIHCNADWQPSRLQESEYLDGFNIGEVSDYAYSSNTFIHFVNYRIELPNEQVNPILSGNYLLQVYDREDPERILLQCRFQVVEPKATATGEVTTRTDRGTNTGFQQLTLAVDTREYPISNPYTDLIVSVTQNQRPETERFYRSPLRVEGTRLTYAHQPDLIFPASNEYRRFETVRTTYPGLHVDSVAYLGRNYHAYLRVDGDRSEHEYEYDQTQSGRFLIREFNATDSDLAADYVNVHFTLDFPEMINADIYVDGEMTNGEYDERNRMIFDVNDRLYRLEMPLKQGSYNYQYVAVPKDLSGNPSGPGDSSVVEGNKYETRNEYQISVYHRAPGSRYDRLISTATLYSY